MNFECSCNLSVRNAFFMHPAIQFSFSIDVGLVATGSSGFDGTGGKDQLPSAAHPDNQPHQPGGGFRVTSFETSEPMVLLDFTIGYLYISVISVGGEDSCLSMLTLRW